MSLVNGRGLFSTPTATRRLNRYSRNLNYITTVLPGIDPACKFQWATSTWLVWVNSQFDAVCLFFVTAIGRICGHIPTHNTSFTPRKCLLWVRKMKLKYDPLTSRKRKKLGLSPRTMENFSRHIFRTVSNIQLKLGTGVDHSIKGIAWYDLIALWPWPLGQLHKVT